MKFVSDGRRVRRRGATGYAARAHDHGAGDPRRQRELPDAADRGEQPPVPAARPRLRQPRRAADEPRPGLRLATRAATTRPPSPRSCTARRTASRAASPATTAARSPSYDENREPFLRVIAQAPRRGVRASRATACPTDLLDAARVVWDEALELGEQHGYRNAQVTVLAPTGTIAFMMDCDTTGVEPDIALIKYKKLVGGGFLKIVNQTVPAALQQARLHADAGRGDRRLHRRARDDRGRAAPQARAPAGLRLRLQAGQRRAVDPLHGPRPDDGRDPAVPLGRDQQDRQHARGRDGRGDRAGLPRGLEAGPQGDRDLPRRLEALAAAVDRQEEGRRRRRQPRSSRSSRSSSRRPQAEASQAASPPPAGRARPRSPTSSTSPATRATSPSASTRTASRARSSSRWPRKARRSRGLMDTLRHDRLASRSSTACRCATWSTSSPTSGSSRRASPATRRSRSPSRSSTTSSGGSARGSCPPDDKATLGLIDRSAVVDEAPASGAGLSQSRRSADAARRASRPADRGRRLLRRRRRRADSPRPAGRADDAQGDGRRRGVSGRAAGAELAVIATNGARRTVTPRTATATANGNGGGGRADHAQPRRRPRSASRPRPTPRAAPTAARSWSATAAATSASTAAARAAAAERQDQVGPRGSPASGPLLMYAALVAHRQDVPRRRAAPRRARGGASASDRRA